MDNLGLYIQVPFCASKCTFCNFSSKVVPASAFDAYCEALGIEVANLPSIYERAGILTTICELSADSVYFGGGTPSLLGVERLRMLVDALRARFHFSHSPEFTLEVTPGSADERFLAAAREMGINRLSVGAQTFEDRELRAVGRLHTSRDTRELVRSARRAGFTNISLDLIAGLPYQTESSWRASLGAALDLEPEHISVYLFEIDEKSRLGAEIMQEGGRYHSATVPDDDFMADAYELARRMLLDAGYVQYEISNFALPGWESRHNQKYWRLEPYVGLGAGAHSFDGARRWANKTAVEIYQNQIARAESPIAEIREISPREQLEEFFFLGLRQKDGVHLAQAQRRWGDREVGRWESKLAALELDGWIERRSERITLRESAYLVSNEVFQEFVSAAPAPTDLKEKTQAYL
ncbi:MAG: radical SAM family heme chaperone HemW [Terriglobia bacterium]|jgi:oxygen-independent coproporphyrinogen-3 oxidase